MASQLHSKPVIILQYLRFLTPDQALPMRKLIRPARNPKALFGILITVGPPSVITPNLTNDGVVLSPRSHTLQNVDPHTQPNSLNAADVIKGNPQSGGIWDFKQGSNPETGQRTGVPDSHAQPSPANTKEHTTTTTEENNSLL